MLDDVWERESIAAVLAARTARCGVVLTTRQGDQLGLIGVGATVRVDVLPQDAAMALLRQWAGGEVAEDAASAESKGGESAMKAPRRRRSLD